MKDRQIVAGAGVTLSDQADENRLLKIVREFYDQVLKSNRVDLGVAILAMRTSDATLTGRRK